MVYSCILGEPGVTVEVWYTEVTGKRICAWVLRFQRSRIIDMGKCFVHLYSVIHLMCTGVCGSALESPPLAVYLWKCDIDPTF